MTEHIARFLIAVYIDQNNPLELRLRAVEQLLVLASRDPHTVGAMWQQSGA